MGCEFRHRHSSHGSERDKTVCGTVSILLPNENSSVREHAGSAVFLGGDYHPQQNEYRGIFRDRRSPCQGIPSGRGRTIFRKVLCRDCGYLLLLNSAIPPDFQSLPCPLFYVVITNGNYRGLCKVRFGPPAVECSLPRSLPASPRIVRQSMI